MKILVTGATGFVGRTLCSELIRAGHSLQLVVRRKKGLPNDWGLPAETLIWDPTKEDCPHDLNEIDAVVHLMGESVASGRWSAERKALILASRGLATRRLASALNKRKTPIDCFISASAVGYYPYDRSEALDESSPTGDHFLAKVCQDWEAAAKLVPAQRTLILRFGMVLGPNGGAMDRLRPLFAAGLGGRIGSGKQCMSWIHRDDLVGIISKAIQDKSWMGVYNCVSPEAVTNREFTKALAKVLHRPALLPVPAFALKVAFGQMSDVLLKSQKVNPNRLLAQNYVFKFPQLSKALADVCSWVDERACLRFESQQVIPLAPDKVYAFFSDPYNLERITPGQLNFKILKMSTARIEQGTLIQYRLNLHGISFQWKTLIKDWNPNHSFIDTQERGPYSIWHHTHRFHAVPGGTLMEDEVRYRLPLGWLGEVLILSWVQMEVKRIFAHRRKVIGEMFPQV